MAPTTRPHVATAGDKLDALIASYREAGTLRLPREIELSAQLGISRNTLREALARLEASGVIERRRRLGTFILQSPEPDARTSPRLPRYPIDEIVSIASFLDGTGLPAAIRSVAVEQEPASSTVAKQFDIGDGAPVYRVRRVYDADGAALAIGEHLIPTVLRGHEVHIEELTYGVSTFLSEIERVPVEVVEHTVVPITLDAQLAQEFQVPAGTPALLVEAELQAPDGDGFATVALGRLIFNPFRITVGATGRAR
jgi:DNA-binding GntR family transcriptional regulator